MGFNPLYVAIPLAAWALYRKGNIYYRDANDIQSRAIPFFGGRDVSLASYQRTPADFQRYLEEVGVRWYDAEDFLITKRPERQAQWCLEETDYAFCPDLLPQVAWWPRGAALAKMGDVLTDYVGTKARINYWWRPDARPDSDDYPRTCGGFNGRVDGACQGDHPQAFAADFYWDSVDDKNKAMEVVWDLYNNETWLELSVGEDPDGKLTHLGIGSERGRRNWEY